MAETTVKVTGDVRDIQEKIDELNKKFKDFGDKVKNVSESAKGVAIKSGVAFAAVTGAIGLSLKAYGQQEEAVNVLNQSLRNQGIYSDQLSKKYQNLATEIQKTSKYGDEETITALAKLQAYAGNVEITDKLTKATVNFAAAQGMDLSAAFDLVGKSIGTSTNALGRYGIEINSGATKTEKMDAVMKSLSQRYEGFAEQQVKGLGSIVQLKNAFGDLLEVIGEQFAPMITSVTKSLTSFVETLQQNKTLTQVTVAILGVTAALTGLVFISSSVVAAFGPIITVIGAIGLPITLLIAAIVGLAIAWKTNFLGIQEVTVGVVGALKELFTGFFDFISKLFSGFGSLLKGIFTLDSSDIKKGLEEISKAYKDKTKKMSDAYTEAHDKRLKQIKEEKNQITLGSPMGATAGTVTTNFNAVGTSLTTAISMAWNSAIKAVDIAGKIGSAIQAGFGYAEAAGARIKDFLSGKFLDKIASSVEDLLKAPEALLGVFEKFGSIADKFLSSLPAIINKLFETAPLLIEKFVKAFPKIIKMIVDFIPKFVNLLAKSLPKLASAIFDAIPKVVGAILDALPALMDILPEIFQQFVDMLGPLLETILQKLPSIITKAFEILPKLVRSIIDFIPKFVEILSNNIGPIITSLIDGILSAEGEIAAGLIDSLLVKGGLERIVGAILRAIPKIIVSLVQGIGRGLYNAAESIGNAIGKAFLAAGNSIGEIFYDWGESISEFFDDISTAISDLPENLKIALEDFRNGLLEGITGIRDWFANLPQLIGEAFNYIIDFFKIEIPAIWNSIIEFFRGLPAEFGSAMTASFDGLKNAFTEFLSNLFNTIISAGKQLGTEIANNFKTIGNDIGKLFKNIGMDVAKLFKIEFKTPPWLQSFIDAINKFVDQISGGAFKDLGGKGSNFLQDTGSSIADAFGWNKGGIVPKYLQSGMFIPRGTDTVPAMLTPGERVLSTSDNKALISAINNMGGKGQQVTIKFAGNSALKSLIENILIESQSIGTGRIPAGVET